MRVTTKRVIPIDTGTPEFHIDLSPQDEEGFDDVVNVGLTLIGFLLFGWVAAIIAVLCTNANEILGPAVDAKKKTPRL